MKKKNKTQVKPRLSKKLLKNFMFLTALATCGTIILALLLIGVYINKFNDHHFVRIAFEESYELENGPVIVTIEKLIQSIIQPLFLDLFKIEAFYNFLEQNDDAKLMIETKACKYQSLEISGECFFNNTVKDLPDQLDYIIYKEDDNLQNDNVEIIELVGKLTQLLKSIYLTYQANEINIQKILIIFDSKTLFFQYPGFDPNDLGKPSQGGRRLDGINRKYPNDFTYQYLKWFIDAKKIFKHTKNNLSISYPYEFDNGELGITMCIRTGNNDIFICLDIPINQLHVKMDIINNDIKGIFFLTRINTKISFYDSFIATNYFQEYDKAEFNSNDTYYLDELNEYITKSVDMITQYDCELSSDYYRPQTKYDGYFLKNSVWWNYKVLPVCFRNGNDGSLVNLINIVHVHLNGFSRTITEKYLRLRADIIVIPLIVFLLQGIILNRISQYLIDATAKNIVLPMKNIKKILDNMKKKSSLQEDEMNNEDSTTNTTLTTNQNMNTSLIMKDNIANKATIKTKNTLGINVTNVRNNYNNSLEINTSHNNETDEPRIENYTSSNIMETGMNSQNDTIVENYSDSNSDNNSEEEEYINIRSRDIQDLFCRIINVRDCLSTVSSNNCKASTKLLPDMLFATEKFEQMKNYPAFNICNSNLGNLLMECKKYDIAIMHLKQSDTFTPSERNDYIRRISNDYLQQSFTSKKASTSFSGNNESKKDFSNSHESFTLSMDETEKNKKLIESRYPKLIYAFKRFFKSLRIMEKLKENKYSKQTIPNILISEIEYYSSKKMHFLAEFSKTLDNYLILTNPSILKTNNKLIYALLEKIDFIFKYELKSFNITDETFKNLSHYISTAKEMIKINKDINKPKQIRKMLIKEDIDIDLFDLPNDILKQHLYYLRGKIALFCSHYVEAQKYFNKLIYKYGSIISDANIIVKAFKKLIFISKIYLNKYKSLKKEPEISFLTQYILSKENEIAKFKSSQKDFFLLINTYNPVTFIKSALEKIRFIIENYIDYNDRYCVAFTDMNDFKILSNLQEKQSISNDFFYDFFQTVTQDKHFLKKTILKSEGNFKTIFSKCKNYMLKKSDSSDKKQIYYVYLSNNLSRNTIEYLSSNDFINSMNRNEENIVICLNVIPFENENSPLSTKFKSNMNKLRKSGIVWMNDLEELRRMFCMYGVINKDEIFTLEKYIP